jgi:hypothetical protein
MMQILAELWQFAAILFNISLIMKEKKSKKYYKKKQRLMDVGLKQNVQMNMKLSSHQKRGADLQAFVFG